MDVITEPIELTEEPTLNHIKISLIGNDTIVTFIARTPKSISSLPIGNYYINDDIIAYTLVAGQCKISTKENSTEIVSATLQVSEPNLQATFTDSNGGKYIVQQTQKNENIRKQLLKSFEY